MKRHLAIAAAFCSAALAARAAGPLAVVTKAGAEKINVSIECAGGTSSQYGRILARNLEISGIFRVAQSGSIKVTGTPGAQVSATGRGKSISSSETFADDKGARMAARRFADEMVKAFGEGGARGFATARVVFVNRKGSNNAELYMCHPDGYDIRQLTSDGRAAVGPRWAPNGEDVYYTGFLGNNAQQVYRTNVRTGARKMLSAFKDGSTGAAISPDGGRCAIILNYQGNPELYSLALGTGVATRLTVSPGVTEASPCWSPDGRKIVYVSDATRQPQIYVYDVAAKKSTRFSSKGVQNTEPDWGSNGKIAWTSKRQGQTVVVVADAAAGESSAREVTKPGSWEHPSWLPDGRHLVASRDKALFIVDTAPDGDREPVQIFRNQGNWMNPSCTR